MRSRASVTASVVLLIALLTISVSAKNSDDVQIGVYYFPGWKVAEGLDKNKQGWNPIKKYPEREPLLGWYKEGEVSVITNQLQWMVDYGINYIVFDWYWSRVDKPVLEHALKAYLASALRSNISFSLLWANHNDTPSSLSQYDEIISYLVNSYLNRKEYLTINGSPVLFVFSAEKLYEAALSLKTTLPSLLERGRNIARKSGLQSIYFIGGTDTRHGMKGAGQKVLSGFDALSAYQFHGALRSPRSQWGKTTHCYRELITAYSDHWDWLLINTSIPIILPMSSGIDMRPWGGSQDPMHDNSRSTPKEFEDHLWLAKEFILKNRIRTKSMGVICCWNEYGEGAFIEPTKEHGFTYLQKIKKVFSPEVTH